MPNKDTVVAVISDMQVGSTVALCPPKWQLYDGGTHHASPAQMIIRRQWIHSAKVTKDLLNEGRGRKRLVLVLNGEPIDGDHHDSPQIITKNTGEQIDMAISLIDEWLQLVEYEPKRGDCMYLVRGTSAHEKGEAIERIGRDLDGVVPYRKDSSSTTKDGRYHYQKLRRTVNGKLFHIAHHGFSRGSRAWTSENSISYALKSMYFTGIDYGYDIPDFVIRSHKHVFTQAYYYGRQKAMYGCQTPCWQLKTHFGNMVAANEDINTIGMINFDVLKSGATQVHPEILEVEDAPIEEF
jgi:hypothetical protein